MNKTVSATLVALVLACGSSETSSPAIRIDPTTATLGPGAQQPFTDAVTATVNTAVTWSVEEGTAGGMVTSSGLYTAPGSAGTYHVVVTSQLDPTLSAIATVTVSGAQTVVVAVVPSSLTVPANGVQQFTATVTGSSDTAVIWTIKENSGCGTISQAGEYTAPASAATCHVVATSHADPTKSSTVTVTVTLAVASANESWIWPYNTNTGWPPEIAAIDSNVNSFTHLSPTFYDLNYAAPYLSGVPYYVTCAGGVSACTANGPNNFGTFTGLSGSSSSYNGQTITTQSFTSWAHSRGFKVVPLIYAGSANGGVDTSVQAILCGGNGASGCPAQTNLIGSLVNELVSNNFDGWNFDWEMGSSVGSSYATSFVAFVNALKSALAAAGRSNALVTLDVIVSNINGTYCSGNSGFADFGLLAASSIDRVIIEDYVGTFQTAGWTVPASCPSPLKNYYGSALLSTSSPAGCDYSFTGMMIMMCTPNLGASPTLDFGKAVVGLMPSVNGSNPIAGQAMQALASYGFTKVAVWPQYDNNTYQFMSTDGIEPPTATWYSLLSTFLGH